VSRACTQQEALFEAIEARDLDKIFAVFVNDPLVTCGLEDARRLFDEMVQNTKAYLADYNV
jgi:alpha-galactosidase